MKSYGLLALAFVFTFSTHALVIRAAASAVSCQSTLDAKNSATLAIRVYDKPVVSRLGGTGQETANALEAYCEGILNAAYDSSDKSAYTYNILIDTAGKLDDNTLITNELKKTCQNQ